MADHYSPQDAGELLRRGRRLLARGLLTHHQLVLLDCLVWSCRAPGRGTVEASYSRLQARAHLAPATVAKAIKAFVRLGLVTVERRKALAVTANGGRIWRQLTSRYQLARAAGSRDFTPQRDQEAQGLSILRIAPDRAQARAQEALRAIAAARAAQLFGIRPRQA